MAARRDQPSRADDHVRRWLAHVRHRAHRLGVGPARRPRPETGNGYAEEPGERTALVDVVAGTRLEQWGYASSAWSASGNGARREVPGFGGTLSPDGRLVLAGRGAAREPPLYDARTGDRARHAWSPTEWQVRAATFVSERPGQLAGRPGRRGRPASSRAAAVERRARATSRWSPRDVLLAPATDRAGLPTPSAVAGAG